MLFMLTERPVEWRRCTIQGTFYAKRLAIRTCTLVINSSENFSVRYTRTCMSLGRLQGLDWRRAVDDEFVDGSACRNGRSCSCAKIGASQKLSFGRLTRLLLLNASTYCGLPTT